ncbi:MAG TPA: ATPase [Firmicutes bacterium]|nr:ATPase [Bacillota bacterium]
MLEKLIYLLYHLSGDNMYRKIYKKLLSWKNTKEDNKPLMILGARQVGKTYIIENFCQKEFSNFKEINLLRDLRVLNLYKDTTLDSNEKYNYLKTIIEFDLDKPDSVLFIDEIQESQELIAELKYFCEVHNNVKIICAGSLLGVKLKRANFSFPVGKVKMLMMHPMDFEEFLIALDKPMLLNTIRECYKNNRAMNEELHNLALLYYRYYLITGGMPESVRNFIKNDCDIIKYDSSIKENIIDAYLKDMKKYVINLNETLKIEKVYDSIPKQISNESKKFQFSKIEKNAKTRDYELPLDWLDASNLILTSYRVSMPDKPLKAFRIDDFFKLFINDVGLLNHMLKIRYADILNDDLSLFKGAFVENYVASQFVSNGIDLYYWVSDGIAEIDFLIYNEDGIIPVEVKAANNTQSKSLKTYMDKFNPRYAIRISSKNFGYNEEKRIKSIPLYAVFCIENDL